MAFSDQVITMITSAAHVEFSLLMHDQSSIMLTIGIMLAVQQQNSVQLTPLHSPSIQTAPLHQLHNKFSFDMRIICHEQ